MNLRVEIRTPGDEPPATRVKKRRQVRARLLGRGPDRLAPARLTLEGERAAQAALVAIKQKMGR